MNRRTILKVSGMIAVAGAVVTLPRVGERRQTTAAVTPSDTRLTMREPGMYRISGQVRLDAPVVEISGITHSQRISWASRAGAEQPIAGFTTFEHFDGLAMTRTISVRGGHLEGVTAVPVDFA